MKKLVTLFLLLCLTSLVHAADTKITALTEDTAPTGDDLLVTVNDPGGTPANRKATLTNASKGMTVTNMVSACTDAQVLGGNAGGTGVECQADDDVPDAGDYSNLTGGAGVVNSPTGTIATASSEADFLASGALTCGAGTQGKMQVHTTPLQYCDNAATPTLQYAAYGDSSGNAKTGDSATSFFSSGTIEDARLPSTMDSKDVTNSTATTPAANDNDTSIATTAYVQTELNAAGGRSLSCASGSCDSDAELYTDTKCIWFENPIATDDFKSIWRNSTANVFTITELWAESDQTVTFMLQVDDGTPADIDSVDLAPAAGEAEDTSLDGDATVGASEELDLAVTSVSGNPTWVAICWTGTWDD